MIHGQRDTASIEEASAAGPAAEAPISIGEMARRFNTTLRTLRFYESRGLLKPQRVGLNRFYDTAAQRRFRVIDDGRRLGFTLAEIAAMLGPARTGDTLRLTLDTIEEQVAHLEEQRRQIDESLAELRRRHFMLRETADSGAAI